MISNNKWKYFRSIFGRCFALCAYIRMIYAALYIAFVFARNHFKPDVIFCDQVSLKCCCEMIYWKVTNIDGSFCEWSKSFNA